MQKIFIKNMVCRRCILAVEKEFEKLGIQPIHIQLGEVTVSETLSQEQHEVLNQNLHDLGFEILDGQKQKLIERIKNILINTIHYKEQPEKLKYSEILTNELNRDYSYLSSLFSEVEGVTIEKYIIEQKIERVKELLIYNELTLSEIAFKTGYSSVAHLSSQFKKTTGLTPSQFRQQGFKHRKFLDKINDL